MLDQYEYAVFVAGMPRAGSMWTYNVVRQLIRLAGKIPWPEKVPPDERRALERALMAPAKPGYVNCIKTHYCIPVDRANIKIICNYRDIRDATLSYMRFMKCSFDAALESARASMSTTDHYLQAGSRNILPVDYDDVVGAPSLVVARVAAFIGVEATAAGIEDIVNQLSRERVSGRLKKLATVASGQDPESGPRFESDSHTHIRNLDGSYRAYDRETGFQGNHITSGRPGEWREALSAEQQRMLNELAGEWLRRYGLDA